MATYLVRDGSAIQLDDGFVVRLEVEDSLYGRAWIIVEALSAPAALAEGKAYDGDGASPNERDAIVFDHAGARARLEYLGIEVQP